MGRTFDLDGDPRLSPDDVRELAKSIPNCRELLMPPSSSTPAAAAHSHAHAQPASPSSSAGAGIGNRSYDGTDDDGAASRQFEDEVLSFLVSPIKSPDATVGRRGGGRRRGDGVSNGNNGDDGHDDDDDESGPARINVYCQTGTVGTCRILNATGEVREIFTSGRGCSLDALERILRHPPTLPCVDAARLFAGDDCPDGGGDGDGCYGGERGGGAESAAAAAAATMPTFAEQQDEEEEEMQSLRRDIELADTGLAVLMGQAEELREHARALEEAMLERQRRQRRSLRSSFESEDGIDESESWSESVSNYESNDDGGGGGGGGRGRGGSRGRGGGGGRRSSAREFAFNIPEATVSAVEDFLSDSVSDPVKCVATNGAGTVLIYRSGEWAHTHDGIPKKLRKTLTTTTTTTSTTKKKKGGRRRSGGDGDGAGGAASAASSSKPKYVSLGTGGRYLVAFDDGTIEWNGPPALDRTLLVGTTTTTGGGRGPGGKPGGLPTSLGKKKSWVGGGGGGGGGGRSRPHRPISSVAFGSTKDAFFVVFEDGSWEYRGRGIPDGLEDILSDRGERADLVTVTLGPDGEWFLRASNGKMWWGNATDEFDELMDELEDAGRTPHFVDFGEYGSYFVSHE